LPHLGVPALLEIAPSFSGSIDEFCISRSAENLSTLDEKYLGSGGRFVSEPICLSETGATLSSIEVVENVPLQTEIEYFIRSGENCFNWNENYPTWEPINPGEDVAIEGKYFQLAADLFPDGGGKTSPSVTEIKLFYEVEETPLPPYRVKAVAGNGEITICWDVATGFGNSAKLGYYIYYGEKPGEYLGTVATEGNSPIFVDSTESSYTISGLENGRIYYFAISACPLSNPDLQGELSKEVYARPSSRL